MNAIHEEIFTRSRANFAGCPRPEALVPSISAFFCRFFVPRQISPTVAQPLLNTH